MAQNGDTFWNPVAQTRMQIVTSAQDGDGRRLAIDWHLAPGACLVAANHLHPGPPGVITERFEILAGHARCRIAGVEHTGAAPHVFAIPTDTPHVHPWNIGSDELHVRQVIEPPEPDLHLLRGVERYFETLVALSQQGKADRKGQIRNPLQNALTLSEHLLGGTYLAGIPRGMQSFALLGLAKLAKRAGMSAYVAPRRMGTEHTA